MIGSNRLPTGNPIQFHKNFNKIAEILWNPGIETYNWIFSVEIQSDPMLEFNEILHQRITFVFC